MIAELVEDHVEAGDACMWCDEVGVHRRMGIGEEETLVESPVEGLV